MPATEVLCDGIRFYDKGDHVVECRRAEFPVDGALIISGAEKRMRVPFPSARDYLYLAAGFTLTHVVEGGQHQLLRIDYLVVDPLRAGESKQTFDVIRPGDTIKRMPGLPDIRFVARLEGCESIGLRGVHYLIRHCDGGKP